YFILTLFIAFFPAGVRGTTIVIHKTATDIFVGADSKEIHLTGEPDTLTNKIVELKPSYYFAAAGNVIRVGSNSIFFSLISFDVVTSAKACASKSTGLRVVADACSERLNVELDIPLLTMKDQLHDLYKSKIANQVILEL